MKIVFCACIKNCGKYLSKIFQNIDLVRNKYNVHCIFIYDNFLDNSETLLKEYEKKYQNIHIKKIENNSPLRTVRIAKARNECLSILYNEIKECDFHIMFDADNVNSHTWNIDILKKYLNNFDNDDWDTISFNRNRYYDIWALLIDEYQYHCWGFGGKSSQIVNFMGKYVSEKLKKSNTNSIYCNSAFNGFAIYKTEKFCGITYDGTEEEFLKLIDLDKIKESYKKTFGKLEYKGVFQQQCCEHLYYHLNAIKKNNCKIKISKFMI